MVRRLSDGRIVLGAEAYLLGARTADSVRAMARPVLEELAERTRATAFLSIAEGNECVVALTAEPREATINIHYRVGTRHPIDRGAAGIAILATRPAQESDSEDIRFAREHGYSITRGQLHRGAIGVSSAVHLPGDGRRGCPGGRAGLVAKLFLSSAQLARVRMGQCQEDTPETRGAPIRSGRPP